MSHRVRIGEELTVCGLAFDALDAECVVCDRAFDEWLAANPFDPSRCVSIDPNVYCDECPDSAKCADECAIQGSIQ